MPTTKVRTLFDFSFGLRDAGVTRGPRVRRPVLERRGGREGGRGGRVREEGFARVREGRQTSGSGWAWRLRLSVVGICVEGMEGRTWVNLEAGT